MFTCNHVATNHHITKLNRSLPLLRSERLRGLHHSVLLILFVSASYCFLLLYPTLSTLDVCAS